MFKAELECNSMRSQTFRMLLAAACKADRWQDWTEGSHGCRSARWRAQLARGSADAGLCTMSS